MGDNDPGSIVAIWSCDRDAGYSCGDDVGVAVHRLASCFILGGCDSKCVDGERSISALDRAAPVVGRVTE